jgi:SWI/SNF-related matrix-associated actin-dependent regulator of chromatin subfamily A member 5
LFGLTTDRYLVWATVGLGWGEWEALQENIVTEPMLRFNWYIKSRSPTELRRRVETLARSMEKELAKPLKKERERRQKAAAAEEAAFFGKLRALLPKRKRAVGRR